MRAEQAVGTQFGQWKCAGDDMYVCVCAEREWRRGAMWPMGGGAEWQRRAYTLALSDMRSRAVARLGSLGGPGEQRPDWLQLHLWQSR